MTDIREQRARVFVLTARPDDTGMVPIHPHIVSDLLDLLNEARAGTFVAEPMCVCRTDAFGCGSWDCIIKPVPHEPPAKIAAPGATSDPDQPGGAFPEGNDGNPGAACQHDNHHFDRSLCACGVMHHYCDDCGQTLEPCEAEPPADGGDRDA